MTAEAQEGAAGATHLSLHVLAVRLYYIEHDYEVTLGHVHALLNYTRSHEEVDAEIALRAADASPAVLAPLSKLPKRSFLLSHAHSTLERRYRCRTVTCTTSEYIAKKKNNMSKKKKPLRYLSQFGGPRDLYNQRLLTGLENKGRNRLMAAPEPLLNLPSKT